MSRDRRDDRGRERGSRSRLAFDLLRRLELRDDDIQGVPLSALRPLLERYVWLIAHPPERSNGKHVFTAEDEEYHLRTALEAAHQLLVALERLGPSARAWITDTIDEERRDGSLTGRWEGHPDAPWSPFTFGALVPLVELNACRLRVDEFKGRERRRDHEKAALVELYKAIADLVTGNRAQRAAAVGRVLRGLDSLLDEELFSPPSADTIERHYL